MADILVVDEAHNAAPSAASQYAMPSQRTRLIRTLAPHFEHRLFLTATPHNGDEGSFTSLLELLDELELETLTLDELELEEEELSLEDEEDSLELELDELEIELDDELDELELLTLELELANKIL